MNVKNFAGSLLTSVALLAGCADGSKTKDTAEDISNRVNVTLANPDDKECSYFFNTVIYPIGVHCRYNVSQDIDFSVSVQYDKASNNTQSGTVKSDNVEELKGKVHGSLDSLSRQGKTGKHVRPDYDARNGSRIFINSGSSIIGGASVEYDPNRTDDEFINKINKTDRENNLDIAQKRANESGQAIITSLGEAVGKENVKGYISISAQVKPLDYSEIGRLYAIAAATGANMPRENPEFNGRWLVKVVTAYANNAYTVKEGLEHGTIDSEGKFIFTPQELQTLDEIIGSRRNAIGNISITTHGVRSDVYVTKWNYVLHLIVLLGIIGGVARKLKKNSQAQKQGTEEEGAEDVKK